MVRSDTPEFSFGGNWELGICFKFLWPQTLRQTVGFTCKEKYDLSGYPWMQSAATVEHDE